MSTSFPAVIVIRDSDDDDDDPSPSDSCTLVSDEQDLQIPPPRFTVQDNELGSEDDESPRARLFSQRQQLVAYYLSQLEEDTAVEECESEEDTSGESDDPERYWFSQSERQRWEAFSKILARMESAEDIQLLYPKSSHLGFEYDETIFEERLVLQEFISCEKTQPEEEVVVEGEGEGIFEELQLYDFSVYRGILQKNGFHNWGQFEDLHVVSSQINNGQFLMDGVIRQGDQSRRILRAAIFDVNIGCLAEPEIHTTADHIWIQTNKSERHHKCWYKLCLPSSEYSPTWHDFLWLADLNKHVIDYLCDAVTRKEQIHFGHFECSFWEKLCQWHHDDKNFQSWNARAGCTDFRSHIAMHTKFLRDQAWSISEDSTYQQVRQHPLWDDLAVGEYAEDQQMSSVLEKTVVTPAIGVTFLRAFPLWGPEELDLLRPVPICHARAIQRDDRRRQLGFPDKFSSPNHASGRTPNSVPNATLLLEHAAAYDKSTLLSPHDLLRKVIIVRPQATYVSSRKRHTEQNFRFAWVKELSRSGKALCVIWLVLPSETICGSAYDRTNYPISNELFFTDECNCKAVPINRVVGAFTASVFGRASDKAELIVQLLYQEEDEAFVTPIESELLCSCQHPEACQTESSPSPGMEEELPPMTSKLRNMSLFSGCGSLDCGLEESGVLETTYAIDSNEVAIRAHAVNNKSKSCRYIVGSVNSHLERFLTGKEALPLIDSITAGPPCKGFSLLNRHRYGENGQRNCSLLASTLSWIELFLPEFVIIENVAAMGFVSKSEKGVANACAQAICCLASLGYQVRKMQLIAFEHGASTGRERLYLVAAAPKLVLPEAPPVTHGVNIDLEPIITVRDVIQDLDTLHNDTTFNVTDPYHIPIQRLHTLTTDGISLRNIVQRIPKQQGTGLIHAYQAGILSRDQRQWLLSSLSHEKMEKNSKALQRVNASAPFKTIVTIVSPLDSRFGGEIVHPYEDRLLSLKEIRRAQGIPDSFILVGDLREQIELVGNGVAWQVAEALGHSLARARNSSSMDNTKVEPVEWSEHASNQILQLPSKTTALFKETKEVPGASERKERLSDESESSAAILPSSDRDGKQLQPELNEWVLLEEIHDASELPDDDTIVVDAPDLLEHLPDQERPVIVEKKTKSKGPAPRREAPLSPPADYERGLYEPTEAPHSTPSHLPARAVSEDVYEISDHESFVMAPDGTINYQHNRRGRLSRRSSGATKPIQRVVVEIPIRKREASPTPPVARDSDSDSDSDDVIYLETRPVAKRKRTE